MTRRCFTSFLALAFAAAPAIAQPRADERAPPTVSADGTEVFQYLLDRARLKPVTHSELRNLQRYDDLIVISLGNPSFLRNGGQSPLQLARTAIQFGGAALIASDSNVRFRPTFINATQVNGDTYIPDGYISGGNRTQPESLFLGKPALPFVVPLPRPANAARGLEWELFSGLNRIATNKPAYILAPTPEGEFGSVLASYPDDCRYFNNEQFVGGPVDHDKHFFAVGGSGVHPNFGRDYRFLVLADPSIFINQMMLANDPAAGPVDNLEFAARTVAYLAGDDRQRTRCLLIQNGEVVERFDTLRSMMQPPLPLPNIMAMQEKITDFGNKLIDTFETKDTANKVLLGTEESQRDRRFKYLMRVILGLLLLRVVYYVVKRTWLAKRPADGPPPPAGGLPEPEKGDRPAGIFDRRKRELLRRNNLFEPVRVIVREMFTEAGVPENPGRRMPEVEIAEVVARADSLLDALDDLWKIAYGPARVVTVQRWKLLEPVFERVRQAHADGKWRFV